jgi:regulator of protease activity HflC (stomatin/prohibitin superfamily)
MADIRRFPFFRHLRAEPSTWVLHWRRGRLVRSGRGLSFWFRPRVSGLAEVPLDDREQAFLFTGRTEDFQEANVQGAVTYRVKEPELLAQRLDFSIHVDRGNWLAEPLEQLATIVTQLAQQAATAYLAGQPLRTVLQEGVQALRQRIESFLRDGGELAGMGIELVSVRLARIAPTSELEKALQAPAREQLQQAADEAMFARRALAVEKERAIAENELQNKIELARRLQNLIQQEGQNQRRRSEEAAAGQRIDSESAAAVRRIEAAVEAEVVRSRAAADAEAVELVEQARNRAEAQKLEAFAKLPPSALGALAWRELAGNLPRIERLSVGGDALGGLLGDLLQAGARRLDGAGGGA